MPLNHKGKKKLHTKRQGQGKKAIQTKKLIRSKKQTKVKTKVLLGKGLFDLNNNNRIKLSNAFSPIFDLEDEDKTKRLEPKVLYDALEQIYSKAELYITTNGLHQIPLLTSNNNIKPLKRRSGTNNLTKVYDEEKISYFQELLKRIQSNYKDLKKDITIAQFNIISLQFILLFTEIIYYIYELNEKFGPNETEKNDFTHYSGNTLMNTDIKNINYYQHYTNYDFLKNKILNDPSPINYTNLIQTKTGKPYENELLPGMYIILFLGETSLEQLIKAYINQIYIMGMTMEMEYADKQYSTPFGFFLHDVGHAVQRTDNENKTVMNNIKNIMKNEKQFVNSIEKQKLTPEEKYDIELVLFLLIHEDGNEGQLKERIITDEIDIKDFFNNDLIFGVNTDFESWAKNGVFNALLPEGRIFIDGENELELDNVKKYEGDTLFDENYILNLYFEYIKNLFITKWNECFAEKKG